MNVYIGEPIVVSDMQGPAPDGFHVPSTDEWQAIYDAYTELGLSGGTNFSTYFKSPMAGNRYADKTVHDLGSTCYYWSSTPKGVYSAYFLYFDSTDCTQFSNYRTYGFSIRCFKDSPVVPTASWTKLYGTSIESGGIFWSSTNGLISISSNGTTWYTLMDKNLGATTVYNYGDTLTDANCGDVFQWGNNYGFPGTLSSDSITSSSTQVDVTGYGPGNYYESSTWITTNPRQSSDSDGNNLRGGVSQGTSTKSVEVKNIYIGEKPPKTFTITWTEKSDMSSGWTYSDDAAGLTAGSTAFDEFFGYYGCRLNSAGVEAAKVKQSTPGILDITQLGTLTSGDNVMIAFPRRGIKMSKNGSNVTLSITEAPNKEGYQYYAHTKGSADKDTLYLGAYKMVSGYKSLSGAAPLVNLRRDGFRQGVKSTYDSSAGTNRYSQISLYASWYINALYMMKYGNPNFQSVIGKGYTGGSAAVNTGGTNSQTSASYGTSSLTVQAKLFGLEDLWGNVYEFIDCCYSDSNGILTADKTNSVFQDSAYSTTLGLVSTNYLTSIDGSNDGMFKMTNNSGGSQTTYYTAYYSDPYTVLFTGDSWSSSSASHLGISGGGYDGVSGTSIGARLMYL